MACCLFELCPIQQLAVWLTLHWLIFIPLINSVRAIPCLILWLLWSPSIVRLFVVCNCQAEPGADLSYGDVGYHAYGNFGRVLVEWAIILSQTGNYLYSQCKICMVLIPTLYMWLYWCCMQLLKAEKDSKFLILLLFCFLMLPCLTLAILCYQLLNFPNLLPYEIQRLLMQAIICTHYFTGLSQVVSIKTPLCIPCFQWLVFALYRRALRL